MVYLQIEAKKTKQIQEKENQKQQEMEEEKRLKQEMQRLKKQYQSEMESEAVKKDHGICAIKSETGDTTIATDKGEKVRLKYEEEMQKKRLKEKEQQARLDRLAEKMATLPQSVYSQSSPPIPTIRGRSYQTSSTVMPLNNSTSNKGEMTDSLCRSECSRQPVLRDIHCLPSQTGSQFLSPVVNQTKSVQSSKRLPSPELQIISLAPLSASDKKKEVLKILSTIKEQVKHARRQIPIHSEKCHKMSRPSVPSLSGTWNLQDNTFSHNQDDVHATEKFTDLKSKDMYLSRMEFLEQYPQPPCINPALELQQSALLVQQSRKSKRASECRSRESKQILYNHK